MKKIETPIGKKFEVVEIKRAEEVLTKEEFEFDTELIDDWDYDEHKRLKRLYGMLNETDDVDKMADIVEEIHCGKC